MHRAGQVEQASRFWHWLFVAVTALVLPASIAAQPLSPQAYRLAPGDRISVVVFGQTELSGDLPIDITGNIRLPFVGPIEVANLTLAECHKRIVDRLADGILTRPSVNVQISELRPIFILGDVRSAGAQPFKFGMNVKAAIAVAGGTGAAAAAPSVAVAELLGSEERVRQLTAQRAIMTIRKARIEAQRDGAASFPSAVQAQEFNADLADIVALEKETFLSQRAIQQTQIELLRAQKPRLASEIEALGAQIASRRKQLDLVKHQVEQYSRLSKQGLGLATTEMQLRLTEASYESEVWNLSAQISRLKMDMGALDIRIEEADAAFKRQVLLDLRDVGDRLKEIDVTLPIARQIRDARLQQAGSAAEVSTPRVITITRMRDGEQASFQANEATPLEPGDIVEVQLRLPRGPGVALTSTPPGDVAQQPARSADEVASVRVR